MLILNEQAISSLTDPVELCDAMEQAMIAYAEDNYIMPNRSHMNFNGDTLLLMPSAHGKYFCTKLVSLFPGNPQKGHPVLYGTVILNDGSTGKPLALLNGAKLTAMRTAAVGSVGIRHTSPENAGTLGLIGAGVQGIHQVLFACKNRPIKKITVYDQLPEKLSQFISQLEEQLPRLEFRIAADPAEICRNSEIIITATTSTSAVLPSNPELLKGKSIIAIGSYKPEMIELPDELFSLIDICFIDVDIAIEESGDLIHPLAKGLIMKEQVRMLSDLIKGTISIDKTKTSLYKSVGMALFDLFAAEYIYTKALNNGIGETVQF